MFGNEVIIVIVGAYLLVMLVLTAPLWIAALVSIFTASQRREQSRKEQEELEAKYGAHNAELLEEFNKHHG